MRSAVAAPAGSISATRRIKPVELGRQADGRVVGDLADHTRRVIRPHSLLQIDVAEERSVHCAAAAYDPATPKPQPGGVTPVKVSLAFQLPAREWLRQVTAQGC